MRLTPKREEEIRNSFDGVGYGLGSIGELLEEIDHLRANSTYQRMIHQTEQTKNISRDVEAARALNLAKKALELANRVLAPSTDHYLARNSCEKALELIYKLEK